MPAAASQLACWGCCRHRSSGMELGTAPAACPESRCLGASCSKCMAACGPRHPSPSGTCRRPTPQHRPALLQAPPHPLSWLRWAAPRPPWPCPAPIVKARQLRSVRQARLPCLHRTRAHLSSLRDAPSVHPSQLRFAIFTVDSENCTLLHLTNRRMCSPSGCPARVGTEHPKAHPAPFRSPPRRHATCSRRLSCTCGPFFGTWALLTGRHVDQPRPPERPRPCPTRIPFAALLLFPFGARQTKPAAPLLGLYCTGNRTLPPSLIRLDLFWPGVAL